MYMNNSVKKKKSLLRNIWEIHNTIQKVFHQESQIKVIEEI